MQRPFSHPLVAAPFELDRLFAHRAEDPQRRFRRRLSALLRRWQQRVRTPTGGGLG